jgi:aspartyl protease family protein
MVLSLHDAQRIGIDPASLAFTGQAMTANGTVQTARVRVPKVELGGTVERNVPASVTQGEMEGSLLGMSYLQRFARIEIAGGKMVLER